MSKVYEALRQKESETSASSRYGGRLVDGVMDEIEALPFTPEPGVTDPILQAAFDVTDGGVLPPTASVSLPNECTKTAGDRCQTSKNGFRHLTVAANEGSRLVFLTDPHGLAAEQFRFLRRNLEQKFPKGAVLLITSPASKDGKTLTSLNLCSCLADSGRSTLLIEGDIRQPSMHRVIGESGVAPGVEDVLAGTAEPVRAIQFVQGLAFHVAMVVKPPVQPAKLICGTGLKQFVSWARAQFDWVVIDSPPVLPAADVTHLMPLADAVLAVIRARSTPRELAVRAFEVLGNRLFGVLLNGATIESNPYYRYLSDYRQKPAGSDHSQIESETAKK